MKKHYSVYKIQNNYFGGMNHMIYKHMISEIIPIEEFETKRQAEDFIKKSLILTKNTVYKANRFIILVIYRN